MYRREVLLPALIELEELHRHSLKDQQQGFTSGLNSRDPYTVCMYLNHALDALPLLQAMNSRDCLRSS